MKELKEGFYELAKSDLFIQVHKGTLSTGVHAIAVISLHHKRSGDCIEFMRVHKLPLKNISHWNYLGETRPYPPPIPRHIQ